MVYGIWTKKLPWSYGLKNNSGPVAYGLWTPPLVLWHMVYGLKKQLWFYGFPNILTNFAYYI